MYRPRLTSAILEALERYRLVQVVAPAGAGKTTAVAQAVDGLDRTVAWLTLEDWHRSPGVLASELAIALQPVSPGLSGEAARALGRGVGPAQLVALMPSVAGRSAVLVVDDCHLLEESEAAEVLAALVRRSTPDFGIVLVGRTPLPLAGLEAQLYSSEATIGYDALRATADEAEQILHSRNPSAKVDRALDETGGWVAGLVFESWGAARAGHSDVEAVRAYLERNVLPSLSRDAYDLLLASSLFESMNPARATRLGTSDSARWLAHVRASGVPAVWSPGGAEMTIHSAVREALRAALEALPAERRAQLVGAAAAVYEQENDPERALELYVTIDDAENAERLLPGVILGVVQRQDVELAERFLAAIRLDRQPPAVVLARLALATVRASSSETAAVLDPLVEEGRLEEAIAVEPAIGAIACNYLAGVDRARAAAVLSMIPPGRAADIARLGMSAVHDDPAAPVPQYAGDILDALLARALWGRGRIGELRAGQSAWAEITGVLPITTGPHGEEVSALRSPFLRELARFAHAMGMRNAAEAAAAVAALQSWTRSVMSLLAEAELAVRLERDPTRARAAIEELRSREGFLDAAIYREMAAVWDGGAALLEDDPHRAAATLRAAVESMRRGDRILVLPSALVYLAESERRLGNADEARRVTDEAYAVSRRQGSMRGLLLSLGDFPGVLSQRLEREPAGDSVWRSLGRSLIVVASRVDAVAPAAVHLREFGDAEIVIGGRTVRPKMRKSLELLSFLLASSTASVSRDDALTALWDGRRDDSTRSYLRQALGNLREALPASATVRSDGGALFLEGAMTSESLELFALAAQSGQEDGARRLSVLLEALEIANRGMFLSGSRGVRWIDERRARIEGVVDDLRLDAAELLVDDKRYLRALALVEEALARNPFHERAWRLRMRSLGLLGDADGVLAAYRACRDALAELGLEPSQATTSLAHQLRA